MIAAKLDLADARQVRAICDSLGTLRLDSRASPWPDVVRETRALLDTEHVWCFQPRVRADHWEIPVWHGDGALPGAHAHFAAALATGPREWAWFRPTCPDPRQRNRVVEALSSAARAQPGFFEQSHVYRCFFRPLRLHHHRQLRVILCDGPRMIAWFGALQPQRITARQRAIASALVASLQRRLVIENQLGEAGAVAGMIETALEQLGVAAFVIGRRATILHANAAARSLLETGRAAVANSLADAMAGRGCDPAIELTRIDETTWLALVRTAAPPARLDPCVEDAAARWHLTPRRHRVLALVAAGHSNATIAALLRVTERAIELHLTALLEHAGVNRRAALVAKVLAG